MRINLLHRRGFVAGMLLTAGAARAQATGDAAERARALVEAMGGAPAWAYSRESL